MNCPIVITQHLACPRCPAGVASCALQSLSFRGGKWMSDDALRDTYISTCSLAVTYERRELHLHASLEVRQVDEQFSQYRSLPIATSLEQHYECCFGVAQMFQDHGAAAI